MSSWEKPCRWWTILHSFLPPHNKKIDTIFEHICESGIYGRLTKEHYKHIHSARAQDRNRVLSKTEVKNDRFRESMTGGLAYKAQ